VDAEAFLQELDADQFDRWKAFYRLEPFGPYAEDLRHGMQMALQANVHRNPKKKKTPFAPDDFRLGARLAEKLDPATRAKLRRAQMTVLLGKPDAG
jgi:hypothetical protein